MADDAHVSIGGADFRVAFDEEGGPKFQRISQALMVPRTEIQGSPGAENLERSVWLWTMTDFSGGEGAIVFDPQFPTLFGKSEGGIDTRISGQVQMSPVPTLNVSAGGSTTIIEGNTLTATNGTPTATGTNMEFNADAEAATTGSRTPGAFLVVLAFRYVDINTTGSITINSMVTRVSDESPIANQSTVVGAGQSQGTLTHSVSFTAAAATAYRYSVRLDSNNGNFEVDYIEEAISPGPTDVRALAHGNDDEVWAGHWDSTNSDLYYWNFTNSEWTLAASNFDNSQPLALASSDRYLYVMVHDGRVWRCTTAGATDYANPPDSANAGTALGMAIANNRLYTLFSQALYEIDLDQTALLPLDETDEPTQYVRVATVGEFYNPETADQDLRQQMCGIENGVRWFINVRGGPTTIYEYSDDTLKPIGVLPLGYKATAIHHYSGLTFIAVQFTSRGASPNVARSAIYYVDQAGQPPKFLGYLRYQDPDEEPVRYITSYAHDVFFLQGTKVWRYNTGTGGITLDFQTGASDDTKARGMAIMDRKLWVAYEGQGVFVTSDSYPTSETVYIESPVWDFAVPDLHKVLRAFCLVMSPMPAGTTIAVDYQVDESGTWVSAGSVDTDGEHHTTLTVSTSSSTIQFNSLKFRVGLSTTTAANTPILRSVTARALVVEYQDAFEMTLRADSDTANDRIRGQQMTGRQKAELLWSLKNSKSLTSFVDRISSSRPQETDTYTVMVEDVVQEQTRDGEGVLRVRLVVVP